MSMNSNVFDTEHTRTHTLIDKTNLAPDLRETETEWERDS